MELAQALILTNALGGLSSIGRASSGHTAPHGGLMALLEGYYVEVVCRETQIQVHLFAEEPKRSTHAGSIPGALRSISPGALLPGKLLIRSPQGQVAVPLTRADDHLIARVVYPDDHFLVSVELTVRDKPQRTAFAPLVPPLPDEE